LREIATHHAEAGGRFWVAEGERGLLGCVGLVPGKSAGVFEIKKLYVAKEARRMGLGERLAGLAEVEAMSRGARMIELWSDTRFEDAHRLYLRRGYERGGKKRELQDASKSVEYYYRKQLQPAAV
jgi:putative acetyltransferase